MSKAMSPQDRAIRIELARARAALERQEIVHSLHEIHESLTPAALWHSIMPRSRSRQGSGHAMGWLASLTGLSRRYPMLLTGASTLLSGIGGRRKGLGWRLALGLLAGWKLAARMQKTARSSAVAPRRLP